MNTQEMIKAQCFIHICEHYWYLDDIQTEFIDNLKEYRGQKDKRCSNYTTKSLTEPTIDRLWDMARNLGDMKGDHKDKNMSILLNRDIDWETEANAYKEYIIKAEEIVTKIKQMIHKASPYETTQVLIQEKMNRKQLNNYLHYFIERIEMYIMSYNILLDKYFTPNKLGL